LVRILADHRIDGHFTIEIPFDCAINPVSKTNWEGTGLTPDVPANGSEVDVAEKLAIANIQSR
jgi:hypothetical protein